MVKRRNEDVQRQNKVQNGEDEEPQAMSWERLKASQAKREQAWRNRRKKA